MLTRRSITAHSEKEKAAGNYKGGYGFHPLQVYLDETRESLGGLLRPGNAGSNTADDHKTVLDLALAQIPAEQIQTLEILVRADTAGATHGLIDYCRDARMRFSVGYELTEKVRVAILTIPEKAWVRALDQDGSARENGEVCEITRMVDLSAWPAGSRLIVRRERPHPGRAAVVHRPRRVPLPSDPHRPDRPRHRGGRVPPSPARARRGSHPRRQRHRPVQVPVKDFALNEVWLQIVALAHDLIVWTQALVLDGELAKAEPKRLRYQLLHVAARLAFSGRQASCTYKTPGPGPPNCSLHSRNSKRSHPQRG